MIFTKTALSGATVVDVERREDARGYFGRTYCEREFEANGLPSRMVQSNLSLTLRAGTLRGMHAQSAPYAEDKLVRTFGHLRAKPRQPSVKPMVCHANLEHRQL